MTEDEAKTKPCIGPDPANTGKMVEAPGDGGIKFLCIGSACMAWRWGVQHPYGGFIEFAPNPLLAEQFAKREGDGRTVGGFCGLAGKP